MFLCNDVTLLDAVRTLGANQTEQVTTLTSDTNCQTQGTLGPGSFADNEKDCRAIENFMQTLLTHLKQNRVFRTMTIFNYGLVLVGSGLRFIDMINPPVLHDLSLQIKTRKGILSIVKGKGSLGPTSS